MAQPRAADPQQQVRVVVVNGFPDLLPEAYSGDNYDVDIEEFFTRYRQWLLLLCHAKVCITVK